MLLGDEPGTWVPPGPGLPSDSGLDLDAQTPRLRTLALRAAGIAVLWLGTLAFVVLSAVQVSLMAQEELATWTPTTATVIDIVDRSSTITVEYAAGESLRFAKIPSGVDRVYYSQPVNVLYDPLEPDHARTVADLDRDRLAWLYLIPGIPLLVAVYLSLSAAVGWLRRYRAVRRTGWHPAEVLVERVNRSKPIIDVDYAKGGEILLRSATSTHGALRCAENDRQRAWVGGEHRAMVVLFPRDHLGKRPYAVPASARMPRSVPRRGRRRR